MTLYYDKPWCRCGPYFVGVALAFMFTQRKTPSGHLPPMSAFKLFGGYVSYQPDSYYSLDSWPTIESIEY
jgi:hypothetical protein